MTDQQVSTRKTPKDRDSMGGCVVKVEEVFPRNPPKHHGDVLKTVSDVIAEGQSADAESSAGRRSRTKGGTKPTTISGIQNRPQPAKRPTPAVIRTTIPLSGVVTGASSRPETETSHSSLSSSLSSDSPSSSMVRDLPSSASGRIIPLRLLEKLGSGMDARVYSAKRIDRLGEQSDSVNVLFEESKEVALKITKKKGGKKDMGSCERVLSEAKILQQLRHPNIVKLYQVIDTEATVILVLEKALGDLVPYVRRHGHVHERVARRWAFQMISAMDYTHRRGYIHGDLKPDNILLRTDNSVCITDWAFSKRFDDPTIHSDFRGSANYSPPEYFTQEWGMSKQSDVWCMGATIYAVVTGTLPFAGLHEDKDLRYSVLHKRLEFPGDDVVRISTQCKELVGCMLRKNRTERLSMGEYLECEWLSEEKAIHDDFEFMRTPVV